MEPMHSVTMSDDGPGNEIFEVLEVLIRVTPPETGVECADVREIQISTPTALNLST